MMSSRVRIVTIALLIIPGRSVAQVPWESPQLLAPGTQPGVSLLFVDYGMRPIDGTGLLLTYRGATAPRGIGLRLSATLPQDDDVRISGGFDVAVAMFPHSATFPLDVIWTSGFGGGYGDYYTVGLPVGVSASREINGSNIMVRPYTSARIVLEGFFGPRHPQETFALALAADVGADLSLGSASWLLLRTGVSLGDRRALAIGLQVAPRSSTRTASR